MKTCNLCFILIMLIQLFFVSSCNNDETKIISCLSNISEASIKLVDSINRFNPKDNFDEIEEHKAFLKQQSDLLSAKLKDLSESNSAFYVQKSQKHVEKVEKLITDTDDFISFVKSIKANEGEPKWFDYNSKVEYLESTFNSFIKDHNDLIKELLTIQESNK